MRVQQGLYVCTYYVLATPSLTAAVRDIPGVASVLPIAGETTQALTVLKQRAATWDEVDPRIIAAIGVFSNDHSPIIRTIEDQVEP